MMLDDKEQITFQQESQCKIGAVTYQVAAFFDENKETLFPIIRRLLQKEVEAEISQSGQ